MSQIKTKEILVYMYIYPVCSILGPALGMDLETLGSVLEKRGTSAVAGVYPVPPPGDYPR
jgi:hypothetical protein